MDYFQNFLNVLKKRSHAFEVLKKKWGAVATAAIQNAAVLILQEGRIDVLDIPNEVKVRYVTVISYI